MAEQVHEMFPQIDIGTIRDDIQQTGSAQATIENILMGRLLDRNASSYGRYGVSYYFENIFGKHYRVKFFFCDLHHQITKILFLGWNGFKYN